MSLVHGFTDLIADVPADATAGKVLPSHWNAEHKFPGAGAGEVVFVDADGYAATSTDLTFDPVGKVLRVPVIADAGDSVGITLGATTGQFEFNAGASSFKFRSDGSFDMEMPTPGFFGFFGDSDGNVFIDNTDLAIQFARTAIPLGGSPNFSTIGIPCFLFGGGPILPRTDNTIDLGDANNLGAQFRFRSASFGTNVESPLFSAGFGVDGITDTITTGSLVGKTITITGGIITGFA